MHAQDVEAVTTMCETVRLPGGGVAVICGGHGRQRLAGVCVTCRQAPATQLCDHRNSDSRTCDAPICVGCAVKVGRRDYCRAHAPQQQQPGLPL